MLVESFIRPTLDAPRRPSTAVEGAPATPEAQRPSIKPGEHASPVELRSKNQVSLRSELWIILLSGLIPTGGKPSSVWIAELVRRKKYIRVEEMAEAQVVGRLVPGPTGINMMVFLSTILPRPIHPLLALIPLTLPACVILLLLSAFAFGADRPAWVAAVMQGMGAGAVGMLVSTAGPMLPAALRARGGVACIVGAFLAVGIARVDLFFVLVLLGGISMYLNRPGRAGESQP